MKWLRSNIQHGSRLALLAMAIQLLLSFGHFHGVRVDASANEIASITSPDASSLHRSEGARAEQTADDTDASSPSPSRSDHKLPDDCAICAVVAQANATTLTAPPLLILPEVTDLHFKIADVEFVRLNSTPNAFQPRAPPRS